MSLFLLGLKNNVNFVCDISECPDEPVNNYPIECDTDFDVVLDNYNDY